MVPSLTAFSALSREGAISQPANRNPSGFLASWVLTWQLSPTIYSWIYLFISCLLLILGTTHHSGDGSPRVEWNLKKNEKPLSFYLLPHPIGIARSGVTKAQMVWDSRCCSEWTKFTLLVGWSWSVPQGDPGFSKAAETEVQWEKQGGGYPFWRGASFVMRGMIRGLKFGCVYACAHTPSKSHKG